MYDFTFVARTIGKELCTNESQDLHLVCPVTCSSNSPLEGAGRFMSDVIGEMAEAGASGGQEFTPSRGTFPLLVKRRGTRLFLLSQKPKVESFNSVILTCKLLFKAKGNGMELMQISIVCGSIFV